MKRTRSTGHITEVGLLNCTWWYIWKIYAAEIRISLCWNPTNHTAAIWPYSVDVSHCHKHSLIPAIIVYQWRYDNTQIVILLSSKMWSVNSFMFMILITNSFPLESTAVVRNLSGKYLSNLLRTLSRFLESEDWSHRLYSMIDKKKFLLGSSAWQKLLQWRPV